MSSVPSDRLRAVLRAWELSPSLNEPEPPAPASALDEAERILGRELPAAARELYGAVGGGSFVGGNLGLNAPVGEGPDDEQALATAADALRSWDWDVPDELVLFGGNGAGDHFGLWLPREGTAQPLVVQVGEIFDAPGLAVVGDDLASFLAGWTAYYLLLNADAVDTTEAVAALGVPEELRALPADGSDEEANALLRWASPRLPGEPDPYEHGLTAEEVAVIAARAT